MLIITRAGYGGDVHPAPNNPASQTARRCPAVRPL